MTVDFSSSLPKLEHMPPPLMQRVVSLIAGLPVSLWLDRTIIVYADNTFISPDLVVSISHPLSRIVLPRQTGPAIEKESLHRVS